jgi:HNH endonuclease
MTTSARESAARLADLLRSERSSLADFIAALARFDEERQWMELGYASLFAFLQRELRLSDGAAFYRQTAARLAQKFPHIVEALRSGELCLTTVVELSKILTAENAAELLPRFSGLSRRGAKEIVAEVKPEPAPERTVVTAVPASSSRRPQASAGATWPAKCPDANSEPSPQEGFVPAAAPAAVGTVVEPKTAELSRLHITIPRTLMKKLAAARDALSQSHPGASDAEILEVAVDLLLERAAKRRGLVKNPRKTPLPGAAGSEGIPAHVAREVWLRDGARCQFPTSDGGVCGSTYQCELDHIEPKALGGPSTKENLRVACKPHNLHRAREIYGDAWMDRFTRNPRGDRAREPEAEYATAAARDSTLRACDARSSFLRHSSPPRAGTSAAARRAAPSRGRSGTTADGALRPLDRPRPRRRGRARGAARGAPRGGPARAGRSRPRDRAAASGGRVPGSR